jgi:DNA mismatch repair protein MutS2
MRVSSLLDSAGAQALDVAWLTDAVRPASEYGLRVFADMRPFVPGEEEAAEARAGQIADCAAALDAVRLDAIRDALRTTPDAIGAIARASMGDALADANFFELQRFCDAAERVDVLVNSAVDVKPIFNAGMRRVKNALEPGRTGTYGFYLADAFDAALAAARSEMARAQADFDASRGRALADVAKRLQRDDVSGDEFIVMRADLGELPAGVRVLREAPTYVLCTVEFDEPTLAALKRRDAAAGAVAAAEETVRSALSEVVASCAAHVDVAAVAFGELDVLVAAARFARRHECCVAHVVTEPWLAFEGGRFLPLAAELAREGRTFAPIAIELRDVAVLTGPNMGGKSVCLRTCGFIALCVALGLPVPAERASSGLFDEIAWLGVGAHDDRVGGLLSTFAHEVLRLRDVLVRNARRLLVLVDEFARTTTPLEGKALLVALLRRFREYAACGLAATHLAGIAREAGARHFAVRGLRGIPAPPPTGDLHQALAALAASMDYTIAEVAEDAVTGGDAIALASLLGLDAKLIDTARRHLGTSEVPSLE